MLIYDHHTYQSIMTSSLNLLRKNERKISSITLNNLIVLHLRSVNLTVVFHCSFQSNEKKSKKSTLQSEEKNKKVLSQINIGLAP